MHFFLSGLCLCSREHYFMKTKLGSAIARVFLSEGIQKSDAYGGVFPEMFKLINIMLTYIEKDKNLLYTALL